MLNDINRIIIIAGHYGVGKTNIAVNISKSLALDGKKVSIADLDIVNPYFRTADNVAELSELGINALIPALANTNVDIPLLPSGFAAAIEGDGYIIADVGGDSDGAVALSGFSDLIKEYGYTMLYVYNYYRPTVRNAEAAYEMLKSIENVTHLKFTAIINNSNLGVETTEELIKASFHEAEKLAELAALPIKAVSVRKDIPVGFDAYKIDNITKKLF